MTDHDRYRLLAAANAGGQLSRDEAVELEQHLETCPACRSELALLRRDHARVASMLATTPVSADVRAAVMAAAGGPPRSTGWLILATAAVLVLSLGGGAIFLGSPATPVGPEATASAPASPTQPVNHSPAATATPSIGPASTVTPTAASVTGAYTYTAGDLGTRSITVEAFDTAPVSGTWSFANLELGRHMTGPITCLVVEGSDAWMAGPATEWSEGVVARAAFLWVHDAGPGVDGDMAVTWGADPGQTLAEMEAWCRNKSTDVERYPVEAGDVVVVPAP
jgi:hypothetical protein